MRRARDVTCMEELRKAYKTPIANLTGEEGTSVKLKPN
jgi:hypothetical protein